jgi:hypothetical protein
MRKKSTEITRRKAIGISAAAAFMPCLGLAPEPMPAPFGGKAAKADDRNDITVALRNWFVNRCPLLARLNWTDAGNSIACRQFKFPVHADHKQTKAQVIPGGIQSPFDFEMTLQLSNMVDDIEEPDIR